MLLLDVPLDYISLFVLETWTNTYTDQYHPGIRKLSEKHIY